MIPIKKLGIYYGMLFHKNNDGEIFCNGAFGRYIDLLAKEYDQIDLCVPVKVNSKYTDYKINSKLINVLELPPYTSILNSIKYFFSIPFKIIKYIKDWDIVYVRVPSPYSIIAILFAKLFKKKTILHIVGDVREVVLKGEKYSKGIKKVIARIYVLFLEYILKIMINLSDKVLVNGSSLRRLYENNNRKVTEIRTSTIQDKEIVFRPDIELKEKKIKILYVGYLRHEKGVKYLINSLTDLVKKYNIELTIVGKGEEENRLKKMAVDLGLVDNIKFKGYIPLGEILLKEYDETDIFVLPSVSEGTPRVLLEAMSRGVPVISTNVGGIPFTINDYYNGLLVSPMDSNQLRNKIEELINNKQLRENLRNNSYKFVKENTLEKHVMEVLSYIERD